METITQQPVLSENGQRLGTSYTAGDIELHFPASGRPEIYVGHETIDAGQFILELPHILRLFNNPVIRGQILRACDDTSL